MGTIVITKKQIRQIKNIGMVRGTLCYTTSKGINRMVSFLKPTRTEIQNDLNFRIQGLKNSKCEVVLQDNKGNEVTL